MFFFFFYEPPRFLFSGTRTTTNGASRRLDARVSANGVDRGEIFTRVKASTRGRELSRHGTKLILPAAEEGGIARTRETRRFRSTRSSLPRRFFHPCGRMEWLKLTGVKLMNFRRKTWFVFFLFARMGCCLEKVVLFWRMLKEISGMFEDRQSFYALRNVRVHSGFGWNFNFISLWESRFYPCFLNLLKLCISRISLNL